MKASGQSTGKPKSIDVFQDNESVKQTKSREDNYQGRKFRDFSGFLFLLQNFLPLKIPNSKFVKVFEEIFHSLKLVP